MLLSLVEQASSDGSLFRSCNLLTINRVYIAVCRSIIDLTSLIQLPGCVNSTNNMLIRRGKCIHIRFGWWKLQSGGLPDSSSIDTNCEAWNLQWYWWLQRVDLWPSKESIIPQGNPLSNNRSLPHHNIWPAAVAIVLHSRTISQPR